MVLQNGIWRGKQVVSRKWIDEIKKADRSNPLLSLEGLHYNLHWWQLDRPNGSVVLTSQGKEGQYFLVHPDLEMVVVRNGTSMGGLSGTEWIKLLSTLAEYTSDLIVSDFSLKKDQSHSISAIPFYGIA